MAIALIIPLNYGFKFFFDYTGEDGKQGFSTFLDMEEPHFIISVVLLIVGGLALILDYLIKKKE